MKFLSLLRSLLSVMFPCHSLRGMYERYRPDKLSEWSDLCYKYKGQEEHWLHAMHNKYLGAPLTPSEREEMLIQQSSEKNRAHRERRAKSVFRGNHIISDDGESRPKAKQPRIALPARMLSGQYTFVPPASQASGDFIADLIRAWHTVVTETALERVPDNPKTDRPLNSITNTDKFIRDRMPWVTDLFANEFQLPETRWYLLPNIKKMIIRLFDEACNWRCGHVKLQWTNFYLDEWELEHYTHIGLRIFI